MRSFHDFFKLLIVNVSLLLDSLLQLLDLFQILTFLCMLGFHLEVLDSFVELLVLSSMLLLLKALNFGLLSEEAALDSCHVGI